MKNLEQELRRIEALTGEELDKEFEEEIKDIIKIRK